MIQIHFGWILLAAAVLIVFIVLGVVRNKKAANKTSNVLQPGEFFQPFLTISKHERKEGIKSIIIKNAGKGKANNCRIENPGEAYIEFRIAGGHHLIAGGFLKLHGHPKPGHSSSTPGKYKFILYYEDEGGEIYKIIINDEGEGNGPELVNAFL